MAKELADIDGVGATTIEQFGDMGIHNVNDLATASPEIVEEFDVSISQNRMQNFIETAASEAIIIQTGDEVAEEYANLPKVKTGIEQLDDVIGGFDVRSLIAVGGSTGAGKTQLAFQAAGEAVQQFDKPAVYIETEPDRYRGNRIAQMFDRETQSMVHKISVSGQNALDMQLRAYKAVQQQYDEVSMVVVDSFTSRFRLTKKFKGREKLGARNAEFGEHLQALEEMAQELQCPVILVCQVYPAPTQYGSKEIIYGSSLMMHMVNFVIKMRSTSGALSTLKVENHPEIGDMEMTVQINDEGVRYAE